MPTDAIFMNVTAKNLEERGASCVDSAFFALKPSWIGGNISDIDAKFLSGLIQWTEAAKVVEIGVASGWSSAVILRSLATNPKEVHLSGIDLSPAFYLNSSISTGRAVAEVVPELMPKYTLLTGHFAFEAISEVGQVDLAFIDGHHMHPWATIDMLSVLPFVAKGGWIALHDLNLLRIEHHNHRNRGPYYLFYLWPDRKLHSTPNPPMIGAVLIDRKPQEYLPDLLELLYIPWEVEIDKVTLTKFVTFINHHYGDNWGHRFTAACSNGNQKGGVTMNKSESIKDLSKKIASHYWFHSIDLGNGIVTKGRKAPEAMQLEFKNTFSKIDLSGKTVLDVGAWNGGFSVEAWRRGASAVTCLDHYVWHNAQFRGRETFDLVNRVTGANLRAIDRDLDEPKLDLSDLGQFNVVLFLGVFYHLKNPLSALREVSAAAKDVLVLETHVDSFSEDRPAMVFFPGAELRGDATNWWGPNIACVVELLKLMGFARIEVTAGASIVRKVFHAYRT